MDPDHDGGDRQKQCGTDSDQDEHKSVDLCFQDLVDRDCDHGEPAIVHPIIISTSVCSVQVTDRCVMGGEGAVLDSAQQPVGIRLDLRIGDVQLAGAVHELAASVVQKIGKVFRHGGIVFADVQIFHKDIKSQDVFGIRELPCQGNDLFSGNDILIGIRKNDFAVCVQCLLIPFGINVIVGSVSGPGSCTDDASIHNCVGIDQIGMKSFFQMTEITGKPLLKLFCGGSGGNLFLKVSAAQIHQQLVHGHAAFLLGGVTLCQIGSQFLGILHQLVPHEKNAPEDQDRKSDQYRDVQLDRKIYFCLLFLVGFHGLALLYRNKADTWSVSALLRFVRFVRRKCSADYSFPFQQ